MHFVLSGVRLFECLVFVCFFPPVNHSVLISFVYFSSFLFVGFYYRLRKKESERVRFSSKKKKPTTKTKLQILHIHISKQLIQSTAFNAHNLPMICILLINFPSHPFGIEIYFSLAIFFLSI